MLTKEETLDLEKQTWRRKGLKCPNSKSYYHEYIPVSWIISQNTKHVATLMCTKCFHDITVGDAFKNRVVSK